MQLVEVEAIELFPSQKKKIYCLNPNIFGRMSSIPGRE
jgi:hypothetical protein